MDIIKQYRKIACYMCKGDKCSNCSVPKETEKILERLIETELGEYASILMCVFSNSCEFYFTNDGCTIEAIEKEKIDEVILKCLEKVKEKK